MTLFILNSFRPPVGSRRVVDIDSQVRYPLSRGPAKFHGVGRTRGVIQWSGHGSKTLGSSQRPAWKRTLETLSLSPYTDQTRVVSHKNTIVRNVESRFPPPPTTPVEKTYRGTNESGWCTGVSTGVSTGNP